MTIYDYTQYQVFLNEYIKSLPKEGWGYVSKISEAIDVHSSHLSQVLSFNKDLTLEQAFNLARYLKLSESECEYLILLVEHSRAQTKELKDFFLKKVTKFQNEVLNLKNHVSDQQPMTSESSMTFYSNWIYSGIRLFSSLEDGKTFEEIQKQFDISPLYLQNVLEFLIKNSLCTRMGNRYLPGVQKTLAEKGTPMFLSHTRNWRLMGLQQLDKMKKDDVFLTSPMSLSFEDLTAIQKDLMSIIKVTADRVKHSKPEMMACLNIDLFKID